MCIIFFKSTLKSAILILVFCLFCFSLLFSCFCLPVVTWIFLEFHFTDSFWVYLLYSLLVIALGITLYIHNLLQSTGVIILPVQLKFRNSTILCMVLFSFIYTIMILYMSSLYCIGHCYIFASIISHNLEYSKESLYYIVFTHVLSSFWMFYHSFFLSFPFCLENFL